MPEQIEEVNLDEQPMNYPGAKGWMWTYCTYLGPFTDSQGFKYDLGVYEGGYDVSYAIVHGNECGDYISGSLESEMDEAQSETVRRYDAQR